MHIKLDEEEKKDQPSIAEKIAEAVEAIANELKALGILLRQRK